MIDKHGKTDLLIARLKESLPIEMNVTSPLAKLLAEKSWKRPTSATRGPMTMSYTHFRFPAEIPLPP